MNIILQNRAFFILILNLLLIICIFFMKDPLDYFEKNYEKSDPFFTVAKNNIEQIKISNNGKLSVHLKKENNWKVVVENKQIRADDSNVDNLIEAILKARKFTELEQTESENFGLNNPIEVELFAKNNQSLGTLLIGSTAPKGTYTYVQDKSNKEIYLIEDNLKSAAGRGEVDLFFSKRIFPNSLKEENINKIFIKPEIEGKSPFSLEKENTNWSFVSDEEKKEADTEKIQTLISELSNLFSIKIVFEKDLENLESEESKIEIEYNLNGKKQKIQIHSIGKNTDNYYLKNTSNPFFIYEISKYSVEVILNKTYESFKK